MNLFDISGYEIKEKIGEGGTSEVFLAIRQENQQKAALKVLHPKYCEDLSMKKRLLREAEVIGSLHHHNIVKIYRYGTMDNRFFMVLEYLGQGSLARYKEYSKRQLLKYMIQVCDGVSYIHELGIIHRDLKPNNIMFGDDGIPRLVDFGISLFSNKDFTRLTQTNMVIGTLSYMSPEQQTDPSAVGKATDIYSIGAMLYEVFTGKKAVGRFADPRDHVPDIDPRLEQCILRALEHDQKKRFTGISALREILVTLWKEGLYEEGKSQDPQQEFDVRIGYWIQKVLHGGPSEQLEARHHILENAVQDDVPALIRLCENYETQVRLAVIPCFGKLQDARALPILARQLGNPLVAREASLALAEIGDKRAVSPLAQLVKKHPTHAYVALVPLALLGTEKECKLLVPYLKSKQYAERKAAIDAAEVALPKLLLRELKKALKNESEKQLKNRLFKLVQDLEYA